MSTIVITPTHIASDHNVLFQTFPKHLVTDPEKSKVFVDHKRRFVIACTGQYDQAMLSSKLGHSMLATLFTVCHMVFEDADEMVTLDDGVSVDIYHKLFKDAGRVFLVSRKERFILYKSAEKKCIRALRLGAYASDGSSSGYATGLLEGGMAIEDIWPVLHRLDSLTSEAHTIIPLSILDDWDALYTETTDGD